MSRWFRMYDEVLDDPKVQRLPAEDFRAWVNLLCLATRNEGRIPPLEDVAFALRRSLDGARTLLERLRDGGLIDSCSGGEHGKHDAPHGWKKRQYKSDTSTERVKRFRERSKPVAETPPETETETETETPDKSGVAAQRANRLPSDFSVPTDWLAWARADRGWSYTDTTEEAAAFVDYWHAKSGRDATKLNWQATWRNWCRGSRRKPHVDQPVYGPC